MRFQPLLLSLLFPALVAAQSDTSCWIQDAASPGNGIAALLCDQEKLLLSDGNTANFHPVTLPVPGKLRAIAFPKPGHGFITGDSGVVLETSDAGKTWKPKEVPTKETLTAIHFLGDLGWIAGYGGAILHTRDAGRTWTAQNSGASISLESIFFTDPEYGWSVGWGGAMIRTTDGGKTWSPIKAPAALWSFNSVYFRDRKNGWATGQFGLMLRTRDGGDTWEQQTAPVNASLRSMYFDSSGRGWLTAENTILTSTDGGETWTSSWNRKLAFLHTLAPMGDTLLAAGPFSLMAYRNGQWKELTVFPRTPSS
ncbi:MAG: YCF48-related protein [Bryobacteraceae bacterium]